MDAGPISAAHHAAHNLTRAEGFVLGPLSVDPPSRRISVGARSEMLEPRVMQVLVALGGSEGRVLSRDDLIEQCWDGIIVGDKAIDRAISLLRHALDDFTGGAVRLETITKVGFRLIADGQVPDAGSGAVQPGISSTGGAGVPVWSRTWTRRAIASGIAVSAAGAALAWAGWFRPKRHEPDPRAVALFQRGQAILQSGDDATKGEAIKFFRQAVAIDPRYAEAWAGIAIGLRHPMWGPIVPLGDPQVVRTAAGRALALDPDNADARLALISAYPWFRRWLETEKSLRAFLRDHPDSALGNVALGHLLLEVGRLEEAIDHARRVTEIDPVQQIGWATLAQAYHFAGRNHEAANAIAEGMSRWPQSSRLWFFGSEVLAASNRFAESAAYLRDSSRRPRLVPQELVEHVARMYDALATPSGTAASVETILETDRRHSASSLIENICSSAPMRVRLGLTAETLELLDAYYFGGSVNGQRVAPPGPLDPRPTYTLFSPEVLALKDDPRHASLLERTGLENCWRKSGTQPDFRRR
jgi:DNA-binding winged helix-turn-helix (wHTH) protein/tetratricopeptide (TPR) repeat protein